LKRPKKAPNSAIFGNVPNGDYKLEITASDVPIKNEGTRDQATTVKVTIDIIEPEEFKGRKIFGNYNVEHPKAQVQEIGQKQFSCLLRALGMTESPEESDELHFISFTARIGMGKDSKEKNADGSPQYPGAQRNQEVLLSRRGQRSRAIRRRQPASAGRQRQQASGPRRCSGCRPRVVVRLRPVPSPGVRSDGLAADRLHRLSGGLHRYRRSEAR
jgi:hypothetical protein